MNLEDRIENELQDAHEREFIPAPPRIVYADKCPTCNGQPMWSCDFVECDEKISCFVLCWSCKQYGFNKLDDSEVEQLLSLELVGAGC